MSRLIGFLRVAIPILAVTLWASCASAAVTTGSYLFTSFNTTNGTVTSPYATIEIEADDVTGLIKFDVTNYGTNIAAFGGLGFNTSIAQSAIGTVSSNMSSFSWDYAPPPNNLDGYGEFTIFANGANGSNAIASMHVEVQLTAGNFSQATAANVTIANDKGNYFAAEYFPGPEGSPTGNTGWIAVNDLAPVPEPTSLAIWGLGMVAAGFGVRRMRRK